MMSDIYKSMIKDFLVEGNEDYIGLWEIIAAVSGNLKINRKKATATEANKLWAGITKLITMMLENGFVAVDLTDHGGCNRWPEQEPKQVINRIRNDWVRLKGDKTAIGLIVWFKKI